MKKILLYRQGNSILKKKPESSNHLTFDIDYDSTIIKKHDVCKFLKTIIIDKDRILKLKELLGNILFDDYTININDTIVFYTYVYVSNSFFVFDVFFYSPKVLQDVHDLIEYIKQYKFNLYFRKIIN